MEYNFSETCMCLFWKFMIKAFIQSVFFCYSKIFCAETFLDLSLRRTCQAIRQKRCQWVKCKVRKHDFGFNVILYFHKYIKFCEISEKLSAKSLLWKIVLFFVFSFDSMRPSLLEHGIWDQVRVDGGKEFNLICHTQEHLQKFRTNIARKPFHKSKSTDVRALGSFYFNEKICRTLFRSDFFFFSFWGNCNLYDVYSSVHKVSW